MSDAASDSSLQMAFNVLAPSSVTSTTLVPGEVLTVHVQVTDPYGTPIPDQRLDFALLGQPNGSSLDGVYATTDADGLAQIFLRAGQLAAQFQLRVSAGGTSSYLGINVVATVQVGLDVTISPNVAPYVKNVAIRAYAARSCDEVTDVPPSAEAIFNPAAGTLSFSNLSAGTSYAIVATATDSSGTTPYTACIVVDDPETTPSIVTDFGVSGPSSTGTGP